MERTVVLWTPFFILIQTLIWNALFFYPFFKTQASLNFQDFHKFSLVIGNFGKLFHFFIYALCSSLPINTFVSQSLSPLISKKSDASGPWPWLWLRAQLQCWPWQPSAISWTEFKVALLQSVFKFLLGKLVSFVRFLSYVINLKFC